MILYGSLVLDQDRPQGGREPPPQAYTDYFGFQYMRDIDAREGGHNTSFLTKIAHNMLTRL
jgi:hypothetical protein